MATIESQQEYNEIFPKHKSFKQIDSLREKALSHALDIRKFEIELYWKRATYFWAFIAAAFAGYFAMLTADTTLPHETYVLVNSIGLSFSVAWYFVNRGSKFWQNNWERHVDLLEDDIIGPLYKTAIDPGTCYFRKLHKEYPFSVSKINQMLSLFIIGVWIFLIIQSISEIYCLPEPFVGFDAIVLVVMVLVLLLSLFFFGGSDKATEDKKMARNRRRLVVRSSFFQKGNG